MFSTRLTMVHDGLVHESRESYRPDRHNEWKHPHMNMNVFHDSWYGAASGRHCMSLAVKIYAHLISMAVRTWPIKRYSIYFMEINILWSSFKFILGEHCTVHEKKQPFKIRSLWHSRNSHFSWLGSVWFGVRFNSIVCMCNWQCSFVVLFLLRCCQAYG